MIGSDQLRYLPSAIYQPPSTSHQPPATSHSPIEYPPLKRGKDSCETQRLDFNPRLHRGRSPPDVRARQRQEGEQGEIRRRASWADARDDLREIVDAHARVV